MPRIGADLDVTEVVLDDLAHDGEAEARAPLFAVGREALEELVADGRGNAWAVIVERELQRVVFTRVVRKVCGKVTESLGGPLGLVQAGRGSSECEGCPAGQQFDVSRGSPVYVVVV